VCSPSSGERVTSVALSDILIGLPTVRYLPLAARRVIDLDDGAGLAQRSVLGDLFHRQDGAAGDVVLVEDVHGLELVLGPLLSGQVSNKFNWLAGSGGSNREASACKAHETSVFSNTDTDKICRHV
jgi:hypothetical protein